MRDYKNVPDYGEGSAKGQFKLDAGKSPVFKGFMQYFPRAMRAVADISQYGFEKYREWGGWKKLADAPNRYEDALARHQIDMAKGEKFDQESGRWHIAHRAWNAMATLELALIELEDRIIKPDPKPQGGWRMDNARLPVREQMDPVPFPTTGKASSSCVDSRDWTGHNETEATLARHAGDNNGNR